MPRIPTPSLESQITQRAITAAAAAATTYVRPARFPRWVRRGVSMSNTLTAVGMAVVGDRRPASSQFGRHADDKTVEMVDGRPVSQVSATLLSASAAGMALVTSGLAIRVDKRVEKMLLKRGVAHPRLWMALGAATVSLAGPWVTEQLQAAAGRLQEKALPKETLASTLADPLGRKNERSATTTGALEAGDPSRHVVSDEEEGGNPDQKTEH